MLNFDDPRQSALAMLGLNMMAQSGPQQKGMGFGPRMGQAGLGAMSGLMQMAEQKREEKLAEARMDMMEKQAKQAKLQNDLLQQKMRRQKLSQDIMDSAFTGTSQEDVVGMGAQQRMMLAEQMGPGMVDRNRLGMGLMMGGQTETGLGMMGMLPTEAPNPIEITEGGPDGLRRTTLVDPISMKPVYQGAPYASTPATQINMGPTSPGIKKVDEAFAKEYVNWVAQGGFADVQKNLDQIDSAIQRLESGKVTTGPVQGLTPDVVKSVTNPELLDVTQNVEEVVQRNLRAILGAQFTEKEGERLISRAFDPRLGPEENIRRLNRLKTQMRDAALAKQEAAEYFRTFKTLDGFEGRTYSKADFLPETLYSKEDGGSKDNGEPETPQTQSEFDALAPGTIYLDPDDGKLYRK